MALLEVSATVETVDSVSTRVSPNTFLPKAHRDAKPAAFIAPNFRNSRLDIFLLIYYLR